MKPASVFFFLSQPLLRGHPSERRNTGGERPQLSPHGLRVVFVLGSAGEDGGSSNHSYLVA